MIQARGITTVYHSGEVAVHAVQGVNLDRYAGESGVLHGPSGSGKSACLTSWVVWMCPPVAPGGIDLAGS